MSALSTFRNPESVGLEREFDAANREIRLRDLLEILVRRKRTVYSTLLVCLLAGALYCAFATRRYMATAELQVSKDTGNNNLGLQTGNGPDTPEDSIEENVTLQTQASILQSDTLALKVINDLNLEHTQDFRPRFNPLGYVLGLFAPKGPPDPKGASLEDSPGRRMRALLVFGKNLKVKPVAGTRLIDISYLDPDPKLAVLIVNDLTHSLVDYNFQIRHEATAHTGEWLAGQMADLRKQSELLQAKVAQLQRESGVFSLGETDAAGKEQVYSSVLDKLQQATAAFSQAQANLIGKAAIYKVTQTGNPEAISQLSGSSIFASASGSDTSFTVIQDMRVQEAALKGQMAEMSAKFGPAYPKIAELRSHMDVLDGSIQGALKRLTERVRNDYQVAQQVNDAAKKNYMEQKAQADRINDKTIEYMIARQEAESSRHLYESLFRELKETGVLAGFRNNNISFVDPARVPAKPTKPNILMYMAGALVGGLFLGAGGAFIRDSSDTRVQSLMFVEARLGRAPLGVLPYQKSDVSKQLLGSRLSGIQASLTGDTAAGDSRAVANSNGAQNAPDAFLPALYEPRSAFVEALRGLRTFLLSAKVGNAPKVILVTSSIPGEGKSTLSANLAIILAQRRRRVLLVDADLRHPTLHQTFGINGVNGLSGLLSDNEFGPSDQRFETAALAVARPATGVPHLFVVPSGPVPDYPAELLSSDCMRRAIGVWRGHFDYVIFDGAPVLPVTDSVILSGIVDFTLLTARYNLIKQQALLGAYRLLETQAGQENLGIVLNAVQKTAGIYYSAYGGSNSDLGKINSEFTHENA